MKRKRNNPLRAGAWVAAALALLGFSGIGHASHAPRPYALIAGTVWAPDDTPMPGVKVMIRRADQRKPKWHVVSNREGEFDQRVPAGEAQYVISCEAVKLKSGGKLAAAPVTVHISGDERVDTGVHLQLLK